MELAMVSLAVIVIARNEEQMIGSCIRSCLESVRRARDAGLLDSAEVVLVDSASTDKTQDIASQFPVGIIALPAKSPLSAAAGRFVGLRLTASELVLFVDGDFVLEPNWLSSALPQLEDPAVAAVCGICRESYTGDNLLSRRIEGPAQSMQADGMLEEIELTAVGLYRRSWIDCAGGIQPFLKGGEDRDLAIRLKAAGGRLLRLRTVMGHHYWANGRDLDFIEYFKSAVWWSYGDGQVSRAWSGNPIVRPVLFKRYLNLRALVGIELGLILALWLLSPLGLAMLSRYELAIVVGASFLPAITVAATWYGETVKETLFRLHQIPYVTIRTFAFCLGYANPPPPATEYPMENLRFREAGRR